MNDSSCYLSVQTTEQELELTFDLSLKGDGIMPIKNWKYKKTDIS